MGIADDIKKLGEDIIVSYDTRVKAIGEMVKDTHEMLKGFQTEHKEMSEKLKADLAKGEKERLAGFKAMMADVKRFVSNIIVDGTAKLMKQIQKEQTERNEGVADLLVNFAKDHKAMSAELNKNLAKGETDRLEDFTKMMKGIQKYVADVIKETKSLIKEIQARQDERNKEVLDLLEAFKTEREKMAANWEALTIAMERKRGGKPVVTAGAKTQTVKKAVSTKKKPAKKKTAPKKVKAAVKKTTKKKGKKKR